MTRHAGVLLAAIALLLPAVTAPVAGAGILTVTDLGDSGGAGQLRTLITAAMPGDTIVVPPGTIVLTGAVGDDANGSGDLDVAKGLTIVGAGAALTVIDGGGTDRVFDVLGAVNVLIGGLTIRNGNPGPSVAGGGVRVAGASALTLSSVVVSDNVGDQGGGGIFNEGTLNLTGSTVSGNSTGGVSVTGVGGAGALNFGIMNVDATTISGNAATGPSASALGGGLENVGTMTIVNSTISGNRAAANGGGGIFQAFSAISLTLASATLAGNVADSDGNGTGFGGGLAVAGGVVTLRNTIIADNRLGGAGSGADCSGSPGSLGHNVIQRASGCMFTPAAGDRVNVRARLKPLADNGGPTQTHALRHNSPAVDAGDAAACPAADQRGIARPQDGDRDGAAVCDIGAYELVRR
jgi:hypothetical protein